MSAVLTGNEELLEKLLQIMQPSNLQLVIMTREANKELDHGLLAADHRKLDQS